MTTRVCLSATLKLSFRNIEVYEKNIFQRNHFQTLEEIYSPETHPGCATRTQQVVGGLVANLSASRKPRSQENRRKMYKLRLLPFNTITKSVRSLHQAQANVIQTQIDRNSNEYQVKD